ncbi:MAG: bifunctional diaminohydroxyphosphoribosylaminopyrimidine deaminase/5-amino-6-(5-phosphoribosylamino)uracil reductase RibD [Myxococcota bacterium]
MDPERAMRLALTQARRASGRSFPNPAVGAVVFRGEQILGRGFTRPPGGPHAEVVALDRARQRHGVAALRGASLAVTLEPCSFTGRTPPCTDEILRVGIRRVLVGLRDPHPRVRGRGLARLRRRGVAIELGILGAACREQHRGFLSVCARGRPFLSLKLAATLDGRIATRRGESRWISSPRARQWVQGLRERHDAVLVGSETVRADDPELVARRGGRIVHRPVRVVVDSKLRTPPSSRLVREAASSPVWILGARDAAASRRAALERRGVRVLAVSRRGPTLQLRRALERLAQEGITTLLCEGGGRLAAALLRGGLVDELHWVVAPRLLGADAKPGLGPLEIRRLADAVSLEGLKVRRLGPDLHLCARPAGGGGGG